MCFVNCYLSTSLSCFLSYKTRLGLKVSFLNWEKPRRRRQIPIYPILSYLSYPILSYLSYISLSILLQTSESAGSMYCCRCWLVSTLCDPRDCSTPGFSVFRHLPEFAQTHVHWVGYPMQPSHPLSPSSPVFPSIFSSELALRIRWPEYWSSSPSSVLLWDKPVQVYRRESRLGQLPWR